MVIDRDYQEIWGRRPVGPPWSEGDGGRRRAPPRAPRGDRQDRVVGRDMGDSSEGVEAGDEAPTPRGTVRSREETKGAPASVGERGHGATGACA